MIALALFITFIKSFLTAFLTAFIIAFLQKNSHIFPHSLPHCSPTRPEEAVHTFPFLVTEAAFLAGPDKTQFLFLLEQGSLALRVLQLSRAEGYRGQEAAWSRAPHLHLGPGPTVQALNCSQAKWQVGQNWSIPPNRRQDPAFCLFRVIFFFNVFLTLENL